MSAQDFEWLPWGGLGALGLATCPCTNAQHWPTVICFTPLASVLVQEKNPRRSIFGNRASGLLGEISDPVYIVHWFLLNESMPALATRWGPTALSKKAALAFDITLLLAALTSFTAERPAHAQIRKGLET